MHLVARGGDPSEDAQVELVCLPEISRATVAADVPSAETA
jgi:hypothetical protein